MPNNSILSLNPILLHIRTPFLEPQITYFKIYPFSMLQYRVTKFISMKIKSPPMFLRHVKHATTAWPMLIFPFHHEVNVYGHRRKVFSSPVAFYSYATSWEKAKGTNPKLVAQRVPNRISFFMPPRGTRRTFLTHRSIGPRPIIDRRSFLFLFTPPRGTGRNFSTHCSLGP